MSRAFPMEHFHMRWSVFLHNHKAERFTTEITGYSVYSLNVMVYRPFLEYHKAHLSTPYYRSILFWVRKHQCSAISWRTQQTLQPWEILWMNILPIDCCVSIPMYITLRSVPLRILY